MKLFKCFALFMALIAGFGDINAFEGKVRVVLDDSSTVEFDLKDGMEVLCYRPIEPETVMFAILEPPIIWNENNNPVADTYNDMTGAVLYETPVVNVRDVSFTGDLVGVDKVIPADITVSFKENVIMLNGVEDSVEVAVSTLAGNIVLHKIYGNDDVIDVKKFGTGVYVVKVGKQSFKMLVK